MRIHLHSRGPRVSSDLGLHATRRLRFALDRFADRIRSVVVQFRDPNGPRGGVDALCQLRVSLTNGEVLVVEQLSEDPFLAVGRAADRMRRTVRDRIERRRERRRSHRSHDRAA
jgi:putative sigma-54 modulation protein